jgi:putative flippase GtrA
MIKLIYEKINQYKKITRYLVAGSTAAGATFFTVYFLTDIIGLWYLLSSVLAFFVGVIISFTLQKYWTFRGEQAKQTRHQLILFISFAAFGMAINAAGMYLLVDKIHLWYMIAQFITAAGIAAMNYFVYQSVIFKHKTTTGNES